MSVPHGGAAAPVQKQAAAAERAGQPKTFWAGLLHFLGLCQ